MFRLKGFLGFDILWDISFSISAILVPNSNA